MDAPVKSRWIPQQQRKSRKRIGFFWSFLGILAIFAGTVPIRSRRLASHGNIEAENWAEVQKLARKSPHRMRPKGPWEAKQKTGPSRTIIRNKIVCIFFFCFCNCICLYAIGKFKNIFLKKKQKKNRPKSWMFLNNYERVSLWKIWRTAINSVCLFIYDVWLIKSTSCNGIFTVIFGLWIRGIDWHLRRCFEW